MSCISFTKINRPTILLFFFFLFSSISFCVPKYIDGIVPETIGLFDTICQLGITIPYFIRKFYKNKKIFKKKLSSYSNKDYIIFALMLFVNIIEFTISISYDNTLDYIHTYYLRYTMNLMLLLFFSKYILINSEFHIHHLIGLIIVILGGGIDDFHKYSDFDRDDDYKFNWKHIILIILETVLESLLFAYKKYLMDVKYISLYVVCFIFNFVNLIYLGILFIFKQFNSRIWDLDNTHLELFDFEFEKDLKVISAFIISIILNCIYYYFYYKILYFFTPSHMILPIFIDIIIIDIENAVDENEGILHWITIVIVTCIILFGFFICLEIIELNFCNLNRNLRNKIADRGNKQLKEDLLSIENILDNKEEDLDKKDDGGIELEFGDGYLVTLNKRESHETNKSKNNRITSESNSNKNRTSNKRSTTNKTISNRASDRTSIQ